MKQNEAWDMASIQNGTPGDYTNFPLREVHLEILENVYQGVPFEKINKNYDRMDLEIAVGKAIEAGIVDRNLKKMKILDILNQINKIFNMKSNFRKMSHNN